MKTQVRRDCDCLPGAGDGRGRRPAGLGAMGRLRCGHDRQEPDHRRTDRSCWSDFRPSSTTSSCRMARRLSALTSLRRFSVTDVPRWRIHGSADFSFVEGYLDALNYGDRSGAGVPRAGGTAGPDQPGLAQLTPAARRAVACAARNHGSCRRAFSSLEGTGPDRCECERTPRTRRDRRPRARRHRPVPRTEHDGGSGQDQRRSPAWGHGSDRRECSSCRRRSNSSSENKQLRDTDAAVMNMQLVDVARRARSRRRVLAGAGDGLRGRGGSREASRGTTCSSILLPTMQQAIATLLTTYEPEFLRFGFRLFIAFATILIAWHGIRMMLCQEGLGEQMFGFAKLLLFMSFGYAMIAFYEAPMPGIGVSFSNLITDQAYYFASILDARSLENIFQHFDELCDHFVQPDAWSILANLMYWLVLIVVALREGGFAGDRRVRPDRQRGLRAARSDLRAVLHCAQA